MIVLFYSGHHVIMSHPVDPLVVGNYFKMYCKSEQFMWEEGKFEDRIMVINIP